MNTEQGTPYITKTGTTIPVWYRNIFSSKLNNTNRGG